MSHTTCFEDVDRSLKACRESAELDVNTVCARLHRSLVAFADAFEKLCRMNDEWREEVFRGVREYDIAVDQGMQSRFKALLSIDSEDTQKWILLLASQRDASATKAIAEFQRCIEEAKDTIANWTKPQLSEDPMLREMTLNREQSRKIKELVGSDW